MNDRQRLEAIVAVVCRYLPPDGINREEAMSQIIELVDPLPEQEPVAWMYEIFGDTVLTSNAKKIDLVLANGKTVTPLYTAPPKREWVSLTDEDVGVFKRDYQSGEIGSFVALTSAIEAKLKELNQ
jgi:hypothetical protein